MKKLFILLLCWLVLFTGCNIQPETKQINKIETTKLSGTYEIVRVVDGDTIIASVDGKDIKIRLIGIDTPESVHPDKSQNTEAGKTAADYMAELLTDESIYLEYDIDLQDDYQRTLAYVYLSDGKTMINKLLLEAGQASIMTVQPNSKYADDFYILQKKAQEEKIGIWKE